MLDMCNPIIDKFLTDVNFRQDFYKYFIFDLKDFNMQYYGDFFEEQIIKTREFALKRMFLEDYKPYLGKMNLEKYWNNNKEMLLERYAFRYYEYCKKENSQELISLNILVSKEYHTLEKYAERFREYIEEYYNKIHSI